MFTKCEANPWGVSACASDLDKKIIRNVVRKISLLKDQEAIMKKGN